MISRKPKLQRQRKIFKQQGKNFPRANQMNINVATWGRLLKRSSPSIQDNHTQPSSESPPSGMDIRGVIKKYGECLNKKNYYSKRHSAINPPQNTPPCFTHLSHHSCNLLKQFWKSSFMSVFSCAVVAASMS